MWCEGGGGVGFVWFWFWLSKEGRGGGEGGREWLGWTRVKGREGGGPV